MTTTGIHIVPFSKAFEDKALAMEKSAVQGRHVQLEIVKEQFLSRAIVFDDYYACMALNEQQEVIASSVAAKTIIRVNGRETAAGIAFDTKVAEGWRKKGIGRQMAKHLFSVFFTPQKLQGVFMTAKRSNFSALNLAKWWAPGTSLYPFVYLAIPSHTKTRINEPVMQDRQLFHVQLEDSNSLPANHYRHFVNGLGFFNTSRLYTLKIKKISALYKVGIRLLKMIAPGKYATLPAEGSTLSCAVLFNHTASTISGIHEVLNKLQTDKIDQLLVCCQKNDVIYKAVRPLAIHCYDYWVLSDFILRSHDAFTIDARCL